MMIIDVYNFFFIIITKVNKIFYVKVSSNILECVKTGKIDELEQMVKRGASINEVDKSRDQFTPLHCAAYYGSLEVAINLSTKNIILMFFFFY
jgi:hypothetical protein